MTKGFTTFTFGTFLLFTEPINHTVAGTESASAIVTGQLLNIITDSTADTLTDPSIVTNILHNIQNGNLSGIFNSITGFIIYNTLYQVAISANLIKDNKTIEIFLNTLKQFVSLSIPKNQTNLLQIVTSYNKIFDEIKKDLIAGNSKTKAKNQLKTIKTSDLMVYITAIENYCQNKDKSNTDYLQTAFAYINSINDENLSSNGKKYPNDLKVTIKGILKNIFRLIALHNLSEKHEKDKKNLDYTDVMTILSYRDDDSNILKDIEKLNSQIKTKKTQFSSFWQIARETYLKGSFNMISSQIMSIGKLIIDFYKKSGGKNTFEDIANQYGNMSVKSIITPVVSTAVGFVPLVGTLLSTLTWIADNYIGRLISQTDATNKMLEKFTNVKADITERVKYLFDGLFLSLDFSLNKINTRSISNIKTSYEKSFISAIFNDLEKIFNKIHEDKSNHLKPLTANELCKILTEIKIDKATILDKILDKHIPQKFINKKDKIREYYKKFVSTYCQLIQLTETLPNINEYYNFCIANKATLDTLVWQDNKAAKYDKNAEEYAKIIKSIILFYDSKKDNKILGNDFNLKQTLTQFIEKFNHYTKNNKNLANDAEKLMDTLSLCIIAHERSDGIAVKIGRALHVDRAKQKEKGNKALSGKLGATINWATKKLTNSKFKIYTNKMLEAIVQNKGIHFYNPNKIKGITNEIEKELKNISNSAQNNQ